MACPGCMRRSTDDLTATRGQDFLARVVHFDLVTHRGRIGLRYGSPAQHHVRPDNHGPFTINQVLHVLVCHAVLLVTHPSVRLRQSFLEFFAWFGAC